MWVRVLCGLQSIIRKNKVCTLLPTKQQNVERDGALRTVGCFADAPGNHYL